MKCEHLSQSRINLYNECPFAYYLQYSYDGEPFARTHIIPLENGSAVHEAIEESLIQYRMGEEWDADAVVSNYAKCAFKHGLHIGLMKEMSTSLKVWAKDFVPPANILEIEKRHDITIDDVPMVLIMDMVEKDGDTLIIHDWKSNVMPYDRERMADDIQAPLYLYITMKYLYPDYKNYKFIFEFVRHNLSLEYEYDIEDLEIVWEYAKKAYITILEDTKPVARPSYICAGCPGAVHEMCPMVKKFREYGLDSCIKALSDSLMKNETFADDTEIAKVIVEHRSIKGAEDMIKSLKTNTKKKLESYLMVNDIVSIEVVGSKVSMVNRTDTVYDPLLVFNALPTDKRAKAISVRKGITDGFIKDGSINAISADEIKRSAKRIPSASYIKVSKPIKKKKTEDDGDGW